jgi:hypothetical protein
VIGGAALGARAISDAGSRDMASEWAGPDPASPRSRIAVAPDDPRRTAIRRP